MISDRLSAPLRVPRGSLPAGLIAALTAGLAACGGAGGGVPPAEEAAVGAGDAMLVAVVEGLSGPEAVRYDPQQDVYFVANFGPRSDEPRDDNGFISRVSVEGEVETLRFATGTADQPLHMPRGMVLTGDTLWVADVDGVHGFHRMEGTPLTFIDFTAHEPGFLNDIAVGLDGHLYVTDTGRSRVYRVARGEESGRSRGPGSRVEVAIEDSLTGPPNGITWDEGRGAFLLAPWGGGQLIRWWTPGSGLSEGVTVPGGRFDGIEVVDGRMVVASQTDSTIWVVDDGEPRAAARLDGAPADIGVDTRRGRVAIPYIALDRVEIWTIPGISADR